MNAYQHNIIGFQTGSVYSDIQTFLNDESLSPRTRIEYEHDIKLFFGYKNKSIESLTPNDLQYENKHILQYRNFLIQDKKLHSSTVNRKIASLCSLYAFLKRNKYDIKYNIDCDVFQVKKLKTKSKSYGYLSLEEVEAMIQLVKKQVKGYEKSMLIRLASRSSIREAALLSLTWDEIVYNAENDCYLIKTIDKGEKETNQPISKQLYNDLLEIKNLKYYAQYQDNRIFHISENTIHAMMKTLCDELQINNQRKVVFHSLRSVAANYLIDVQGDIIAAQKQLNHSNMNTTYNHYINKKIDVSRSGGILLDQNISDDILDELSKEELLNLIKGKSDILNRMKHLANEYINQFLTANP